jgi:adenosylcobinamide kinase / adenosylcobinamide-phosphate guanylyltransferase
VSLSTFVTGGARSGKSRFAVAEHAEHRRVVFLATGEARDADMAARIARHRAERPEHWTTIEEPLDLVTRAREVSGDLDASTARRAALARGVDAIVIDCLTLWVANRLLARHTDDAILEGAADLADLIVHKPCAITIVSNEVGSGVHPETAAGLRFRDLLGAVNQRVAAACDRVVLLVAGVPLTVKSSAPPPHDLGQQAP